MESINSCNPESVRVLLSRSVNVNIRGQNGQTPLLRSLLCIDPRICTMLLNAGADVNIPSKNGYSPLTFACLLNNFEYVRILLAHNADIGQKTNEGWSPLLTASTNPEIFYDNLDHVFFRRLIEIVYKYAHYHPDYDPSHIVRVLIQSGADPDDSNMFGTTPLMAAAGMANAGILSNLLSRRPAIELKDTEGRTALMYAAISTIEEVIDSLIHMRLVGTEVALTDFLTPRMLQSLKPQFEPRKEECINLLLEHGADVRARDKKGIPVLTHAARTGNVTVIEKLVSRGADIHEQSIRGITPLYAAAINGHNEVIGYLLAHGAEIDKALKDGETPLMAAVWNGQVDTVELLIKKGANVNAKKITPYRPSGESGLVWAAHRHRNERDENYDRIFQLLADAGAV